MVLSPKHYRMISTLAKVGKRVCTPYTNSCGVITKIHPAEQSGWSVRRKIDVVFTKHPKSVKTYDLSYQALIDFDAYHAAVREEAGKLYQMMQEADELNAKLNKDK